MFIEIVSNAWDFLWWQPLVAYAAITVAATATAHYVGGEKLSERTFRKIGYPIVILIRSIVWLVDMVHKVGKHRRRRMFIETFDVDIDARYGLMESKVNDKLTQLAAEVNSALDKMEKERGEGNGVVSKTTNSRLKRATKAFFKARRLAESRITPGSLDEYVRKASAEPLRRVA